MEMRKTLFLTAFLIIFGCALAAGDFFHSMDDITWDQTLPGNVMPANLSLWKVSGAVAGDIVIDHSVSVTSAFSVSGAASMSSLLTLSNGMTISSGNINFTGTSQYISSRTNLNFRVDDNNDGSNSFNFINGAGTNIMALDESGNLQMDGNLQADGSVTLGDSVSDTITFNAKSNSNLNMNDYNMTNVTGIIFGSTGEARIYWNGTALIIEVP